MVEPTVVEAQQMVMVTRPHRPQITLGVSGERGLVLELTLPGVHQVMAAAAADLVYPPPKEGLLAAGRLTLAAAAVVVLVI